MKTDFLKNSIIKTITVCFLFSNHLTYSQIKPDEQRMISMNYKYGEIVELKMNEEVHFEDSLSVVLTSFSHKKPFTGGPTKATAYLTLTRGNVSEEIMLSVHGIQGKSQSEDGLSDSDRYDTILWNEYKIQLKSFNYDTSIEIIISK